MSVKNLDRHNRWRNKTVAFRVSPDEDREIETAVRLSGLTKQDYITRRLLCRDVVVQGNPRVYKALRNELAAVLEELERIEAGNGVDGELLGYTTKCVAFGGWVWLVPWIGVWACVVVEVLPGDGFSPLG